MIPFFKPPELSVDEKQNLQKNFLNILNSGMLTDGQYCRCLEQEIQQLYDAEYAFVAPNATTALDVLIQQFNPQIIFSPAFTWKSLLHAFNRREVRWLDIHKFTWLPDTENIHTIRSSVIVYNHTFGNVGIVENPHTSKLIYDAAQAFGAGISDIGDATVFGFAPTKPITCGEGGMIVTHDSKLARQLEQERQTLLRMSEFNAAVGLAYLQKMQKIHEERRQIWNYYDNHLPYPHQKTTHNHSLSVYGILVPDRQKLINRIKDKMAYRVYYEPLERGLPNTEQVFQEILCIPSYVGCPYKEITELLS